MENTKKTILHASVVAVLLMYAYYVKYIFPPQNAFLDTVLQFSRSLIHMGIVVVWMISIKKRIIQKSVRTYLIAVAVLLIFWQYVRAVKWYIIFDINMFTRCCWYMYYIPIILIPMFGVFIVEYIGQPEHFEMPSNMKLLYIPAFALITLVLTNDFHCLAFGFPKGFEYSDSCYTHRIIYFLVMIWSVSMGIYFIVMLQQKCRAPGNRWFQRTPFFVIGGALILWILYYLSIFCFDLTSVTSFIIILLLESCIRSGLIRSNSNYEILFGASTIAARIVDDAYHVCYESDTAVPLDEKVMRQAENGPVNLGDKRLGSAEISHGRILWLDDVAEINRFTEELERTGRQLAENNDLVKAELDLREKKLHTAEKNRLYDRIAAEVREQLDQLEYLLNEKDSPCTIREKLVPVCIISAYIKRRSNLLLMAEHMKAVPAKEMEFCLRESLDNLRLAGVLCSMDSVCNGDVDVKYLVAAYDLFQQSIEQLLGELQAILIKMRISENTFFLRLQLDCPGEICFTDVSDWQSFGGQIRITRTDDTLWTELRLEGGLSL